MEHEGSLAYSQEQAIGRYPAPDDCSPQSHKLFVTLEILCSCLMLRKPHTKKSWHWNQLYISL
jgi:hypothetical protein